jgi:hypothetical protein
MLPAALQEHDKTSIKGAGKSPLPGTKRSKKPLRKLWAATQQKDPSSSNPIRRFVMSGREYVALNETILLGTGSAAANVSLTPEGS